MANPLAAGQWIGHLVEVSASWSHGHFLGNSNRADKVRKLLNFSPLYSTAEFR
jgi:hypothetical protein